MPNTVLASRYNNLRNQVNLVLGTSSGASPQYGYGQSFSTDSVIGTRSVAEPSNADKVTAQDYRDLYIDLIRAKAHQEGASTLSVDPFIVGDYETNTSNTDIIEEAYIQNLETLATGLETNRFNVAASNLTTEANSAASSSRIGGLPFTSEINHIFTMTWDTAEARRHYFNAGGQIKFGASVSYTGSQAKTVDWQQTLSAMGTTSFTGVGTTNNNGIGTNSSVGNYNLSNAYQIVYRQDNGAVYSRSSYNIYAKEQVTGDTTSAIRFKVQFFDGRPNNLTYGIDELAYGDWYSTIQTAYAESTVAINGTTYDAVIIPSSERPTGSVQSPLG
jgi:hypothetical protein